MESSKLSRIRRLLARVKLYLKYDLKEIVFPSSLPNPPGYVDPPRKTFSEKLSSFRTSIRLYLDTWDSAKLDAALRRQRGEKEESVRRDGEAEMLAEELKLTIKSGANTLLPYLRYVYKTRAAAYRDAVKQFIEGYQEGFQEAQKSNVLGDSPNLVSSKPKNDRDLKRAEVK